nr:TonB-dependent receptor plug domain-containing protein [Cytophagales bacterium]
MKRKILYLITMVSKNLLYGCILQCAFLTALFASNSEAQIKSIDKTFLRLQKNEWTIKEIFRDMESRTNYTFVFPDDLLENKDFIALNTGRHSVNDILVEIAQQSHLRFKQVNNSIYVRERPASLGKEHIEISFEQIRITGTVTDQEGAGIPGVTVIVDGTNTGTTTDVEGKYSLEVPEESAVLVFSFIGYSSQRVSVGSRSVIDITLQEDLSSLDEIVVVGYGTQRKSDLTGALSSVKSEDITRLSERRLDNLLQGRAAGVQVMRSEGAPGAASSIHIRGVGSIGNTEPLWIIDGVPMNPGNHFNPADIESMEILKDA